MPGRIGSSQDGNGMTNGPTSGLPEPVSRCSVSRPVETALFVFYVRRAGDDVSGHV
mgnify:CR=1 FL=1|jgi:hypothetical protein